ncbi:hypothetical protein HDU67_002813, partial [Dinochytrium kinnereticum]
DEKKSLHPPTSTSTIIPSSETLIPQSVAGSLTSTTQLLQEDITPRITLPPTPSSTSTSAATSITNLVNAPTPPSGTGLPPPSLSPASEDLNETPAPHSRRGSLVAFVGDALDRIASTHDEDIGIPRTPGSIVPPAGSAGTSVDDLAAGGGGERKAVDPLVRVGREWYRVNRKVIMGTLTSQCHVLVDLEGRMGCFFVFPEVSVRSSGGYRLRFELYDLQG